MIILAGEAPWQIKVKGILDSLGYVEETALVSMHAKGMFPTSAAGSQNDLIDWLLYRSALEIKDFAAEMDKGPVAGHEWKAKITILNETIGEMWYIHDYRPLWFLDAFVKQAPEVKIIALFSDDGNYQQSIKRFLEKRLPANLPVLKLSKPPNLSQIKKFLQQPKPLAPPSIDDVPTLAEISEETDK